VLKSCVRRFMKRFWLFPVIYISSVFKEIARLQHGVGLGPRPIGK